VNVSWNRVLNLTLWILQVFLAALFLYFGATKLSAPGVFWVDMFAKIGIGQWFRYFTGAVEVACGPSVNTENVRDWRFAIGSRNGWCRPHASHHYPRRLGLYLSRSSSIDSCRRRMAATSSFFALRKSERTRDCRFASHHRNALNSKICRRKPGQGFSWPTLQEPSGNSRPQAFFVRGFASLARR
jgi:hypothetical protein